MSALTRESVVRVLGPVDDQLVAELLSTHADEQELRAARHWLMNDEAALNEAGSFPRARVGKLIEILETAGIGPDEDDRPITG